MAAESIYSALMAIKATLMGNGGGSSEGGGSGGDSGTQAAMPRFDLVVVNSSGGEYPDDYTVEATYTPSQFKELLLAGKIYQCIYHFTGIAANETAIELETVVAPEYLNVPIDVVHGPSETGETLVIDNDTGVGYDIEADFDRDVWVVVFR